MAHYTSHPIARLRLGRFQFERGVLELEGKDEAEFDALLLEQEISLQNRVKKASVEAAERVAARFQSSRMVAGIDTTANSIEALDPNLRADDLAAATGLEHANVMQPGASKDKETDGNAEPQSPFGTKHDAVDFVDGDEERRLERNNPVQVSLNAVGGTNGSDVSATGESVAEEESARIAGAPDSAKVESPAAPEGDKKPFTLGAKKD